MKLQEKIDRLIPYIADDFMWVDFEYDFHTIIRFHYFLPTTFEMPKEFSPRIDIDDYEVTERIDIEKIKKDFGDDWVQQCINDNPKYKKKWDIYYQFMCSSRYDETGDYQNVDDVDFLLDKVYEFLLYLKKIKW